MIWTSLPDTFPATSMTLLVYLAVGQLTSRLGKSSLPFLMHINTYFVTALSMCVTYPLTKMFLFRFFLIFIPFSSLSLQLQHLAHIGYKSSSTTHTPLFTQLMLLAHSRICIPHSLLPTFCLSFGHPHQQLSIPVLCNYLLFFITFISLWLHQESVIFTKLFL